MTNTLVLAANDPRIVVWDRDMMHRHPQNLKPFGLSIKVSEAMSYYQIVVNGVDLQRYSTLQGMLDHLNTNFDEVLHYYHAKLQESVGRWMN